MRTLKKFENWKDNEEEIGDTIGPHEEIIDDTIGPADYNYNELAMTIQKMVKMNNKVYSKSKKILKKLKRFPAPELEEEMNVLISSLEDAAYMLKQLRDEK